MGGGVSELKSGGVEARLDDSDGNTLIAGMQLKCQKVTRGEGTDQKLDDRVLAVANRWSL